MLFFGLSRRRSCRNLSVCRVGLGAILAGYRWLWIQLVSWLCGRYTPVQGDLVMLFEWQGTSCRA